MSKSQGKQLGVRMIKEILRLRELGLSKRKIAKALSCSRNTVDKYLNEHALNNPIKPLAPYTAPWASEVDWCSVKDATNRGKALQHYWEEEIHPKSTSKHVPYTSFWREYRRRYPEVPLDMHKIHPPGERCEIDYKGDAKGLGYTDIASGHYVECKLFGAICCFSQYSFFRATRAERQEDWLESVASAFEFFDGAPLTLAVDNAKALVGKAHRYDPDLNPEFAHFCEHYAVAPLACRPGKPKDKNLIEGALGIFWRWAGSKFRARQFFSLAEVNCFLSELTAIFNQRIQRKYGVSRAEKFRGGEHDKLLQLPATRYTYAQWRTAKLHPDCHIQFEKNFYSAPFGLRGQMLEVRVSHHFIEIFHKTILVASHLRAMQGSLASYVTKKEHLPDAHKAMYDAHPARALSEAQEVGIRTGEIVSQLFTEAAHPLMYLRRVQGILRLKKRYSAAALEKCLRNHRDYRNTLTSP